MKSKYFHNVILLVNILGSFPNEISTGFTVKRIHITQRVTQILSLRRTSNNENYGNKESQSSTTTIFPKMKGQVSFVLYNSLVPDGVLVENPEELDDSNFIDHLPTKFVIHGWMSGGNLEMSQTIRNSYLNNTDVNLFVVHWEKISRSILYVFILTKMTSVADYFADFLRNLIELKSIQGDQIHLIGHSLGAHICGMVGKRLLVNDITIGRITGLDPALPGFQASSNLEKLSSSDANFVDVIHTCGGNFGILESVGHADFYPNGGIAPMPGCEKMIVNSLCSHSRSWLYFAESIATPFYAVKCDTLDLFQSGNCSDEYIEMGKHATTIRGNYYFSTNTESPFSLGKEGLHFKLPTRSKRKI